MKNIIITSILCLIILQGCGYTITTVYDNCVIPTKLLMKDISKAYILDKSIQYVNEKTTLENKKINGKFDICFGNTCVKGYYSHFNPEHVQSNKAKLTGKMRETSPKFLLSLFVDPHRDIEALIDGKRVWINPYEIESKFIEIDRNTSISFYKQEINSPVRKFQCLLPNQKALDWELSW